MTYHISEPYLIVYCKPGTSVFLGEHIRAKSGREAIMILLERTAIDVSDVMYCFSPSDVDNAITRVHNAIIGN